MHTNKNTFEYLGQPYQERLMTQILKDKSFSKSILKVLKPNYFSNETLKLFAQETIKAYTRDDVLLDGEALKIRLFETITREEQKATIESYLERLDSTPQIDWENIQTMAFNFCKQQEVMRITEEMQTKIKRNQLDNLGDYEETLSKAFKIGRIENTAETNFDDIDDLLSEDFRRPIPTGITKIDEIMNGGLSGGELAIILAALGVGKSQPLYSKILTPNGWSTMGDMKVGSWVMTPNGDKTKVNGVYPQGKRPIYNVEFSDGSKTRVDLDHIWSVYGEDGELVNKTTKELMDFGIYDLYDEPIFKIPEIQPLNYTNREQTINPYELGMFLSRTCIDGDNFKYSDEFILDITNSGIVYNDPTKYFIPKEYQINSNKKRLSLLKGIMDSSGIVNERGYVFECISTRLRDDFIEIVKSFGGYATYIEIVKNNEIFYSITFTFNDSTIYPMTIVSIANSRLINEHEVKYRYITDIEYHGEEEAQCISLDSEDKLYITDDYVVTHNTTIATKIANTAFNLGKNVLQIFFEDSVAGIKRKHMACWTKIPINDLATHKEKVKEVVKDKMASGGKIFMIKMPSITTTMRDIANLVKEFKQEGHPIDVMLIDYMDCVQPSREYSDANVAEGMIMREYENLCAEFNIASYGLVQGNRCVRVDQRVELEGRGQVPIGEVKIGDSILTHKGYRNVSHVFERETQETYKIKTKSGKEIIVSGNHKFPTKDGRTISINQGLKEGDKLFIR